MKKYIFICLLGMQAVMILSMEEQCIKIKQLKKREIISRAIVQSYQNKQKTALNNSQPIPIARSDDSDQEPKSVAELFRSGSSNSLSDQGCSPSFRDYVT